MPQEALKEHIEWCFAVDGGAAFTCNLCGGSLALKPPIDLNGYVMLVKAFREGHRYCGRYEDNPCQSLK